MDNPAFDQDSFRGRNDDGSESAATWKAAVNINWTQTVDENFRVRFLIQETAGHAGSNQEMQLQYNLNAAGWNNVNAASSVVRSFAGQLVEDGDTTQQIGAGTFLTPNGGQDEVDGITAVNAMDFAGSDEVEAEFCVQIIGADVSDADTVELRCLRDGIVLDAYTNTPSITVDKPAPSSKPYYYYNYRRGQLAGVR